MIAGLRVCLPNKNQDDKDPLQQVTILSANDFVGNIPVYQFLQMKRKHNSYQSIICYFEFKYQFSNHV